MIARRLTAVALLALLGACNQSGRPRVVEVPQTYGAAPAATYSEATPGAEEYTVIPGDTVYGVAERFQVPIRSLIELNGLQPPYRLTGGMKLQIPAQREHVVLAGDSLYDISRRYGVDVSTLIRLNNIAPPYEITPGQRLLLPAPVAAQSVAGVTAGEVATSAPATGASSSTITVVELPPPGAPAGEAPAAAPATGSTAGTVPATGSSGSTAPLPPPDGSPSAVPLPQPPTAAPATAAPSGAAPENSGNVPDAQTATIQPPPASVPQPAPLTAGRFLWPVNGKIISAFGPKEGGLHNDGINIAAPAGTPVRAAENGVVAYAGNELRGFGNLLLIRHADGWISAYAHNETLLVKRGDTVTRGQTIARVGQSGNVTSPQLHFELRRGADAVDPLKYLGELGAALPPGLSPAGGRDALPVPG